MSGKSNGKGGYPDLTWEEASYFIFDKLESMHSDIRDLASVLKEHDKEHKIQAVLIAEARKDIESIQVKNKARAAIFGTLGGGIAAAVATYFAERFGR